MKNLNFIVFVVGALFAISCSKKNNPPPTPIPTVITINSISPTSGSADTIVTITGTNFSTTIGNNIVKFNGVKAVVQSATLTTIKAVVPLGAGTGPVSVGTATLAAVNGPVFTYIPPNTPPPAITINSISPTSGGYNTVVTITGTNFSNVTSDNIVKFNGMSAVVQSATPTSLKAVVPVGPGTGPVSVATTMSTVQTGPVFTYNLTLTTYFAGDDVYWRNGIESVLPRTGTYALIKTILTSGTDVYLGGSDVPDSRHPVYWKNGVESMLPTTSNQGEVTTSVISGTDIYFAGYDGNVPVYWKNGVENPLPYISAGALVNTMAIQGADIYFAGYDGDKAVYWKNGTRNILPITGGNASVTAMVIVGNDIYFGGSETGIAVYWKNGIENILTLKNTYGAVSAMAFAGTDIYIAGSDGNIGSSNPVYWKNGTEYVLPTTNNVGNVYSMTILGTDIYFVGSEISTVDKPVYWKNGQEYFLSTDVLGGGLEALSMYLDNQ
ncbi:IPT/TIG domain-containing protein [Mucilaginibacter sp. McL0603]|uniref:IPT/TIG domain-containing protein n=1 Tax=Mucilaginibacter sp. McL0603 TaxID=3415670 RepID=UPI003CF5562C